MMRPKRRAFTLIELLVVIAVIAVLAGIIFPVFTHVQRKAEQTQCLSNLRQLGQAFRMYLDDHRNRTPNWGPADGSMFTVANDWRKTNADADFRYGMSRVMKSLRASYAKGDYNIFFCPSAAYEDCAEATLGYGTGEAVDGGEIGYCGLANWLLKSGDMYRTLVTNNGRFGRLGDRNKYVARPMDTVTARASEVCLLADNGLFADFAGDIAWPHGGGTGNYLMLDGSVQTAERGQFLANYGPVHATTLADYADGKWKLDPAS